jgi:hypothetical protein
VYNLAYGYRGKLVEVRDCHGRVYRGLIEHVTPRGFYLRGRGFGGAFFPFFSVASIILLSSLFI